MTLSPTAVEQLWRTYTHLAEREKDLSAVQSRYRALASTWTLAAVAALGFVLETDLHLIPRPLGIALVGATSSIGLSLLWVLDLLIHQRLLDAAYIEGRALETAQPWLPQVRNNMRELLGGRGLRLATLFYLVIVELMGLVGGIGLSSWAMNVLPTVLWSLMLTAYAAALGAVAWLIPRATSTTVALEQPLAAGRVSAYASYGESPGFQDAPQRG